MHTGFPTDVKEQYKTGRSITDFDQNGSGQKVRYWWMDRRLNIILL